MYKNALISVSNKDGLIEFVKPLVAQGMRVVSSGGTAHYLKQNGILCVEVSEQTGFPEVMGGRVKTLHPYIHMPLLARSWEAQDFVELGKHHLQPFDLVICNLYPFEKGVHAGASEAELIEKIDIGGPTLLRAAAKNFQSIAVVCDPVDYQWILHAPALSVSQRKQLAAKAFAHVSSYDSLIASTLDPQWKKEWSMGGHLIQELRYGENPDQKASWYSLMGQKWGLHQAEIIQGKTLSYNNILDLEAATLLLQDLKGPAAVAVKHNNPCGVAQHVDSSVVLDRVLTADPISVFGGIVAMNFKISANHAEQLSSCFLECVIAPDYSDEALAVFSPKKNLRLLRWPEMGKNRPGWDLRTISGGFLLQSAHSSQGDPSQWKWVGERPSDHIIQDMIFAEKVVASLKSNAIAVVKDGQTIGLGMGQVNRVDAVAHAIERCHKFHPHVQDLVLASDAFFPFSDSIELAAKAGVKWILQPGGSIKDEEVIAKTKQLGIVMALSSVRHFRH